VNLDFKLGGQVDPNKSQPADDKPFLKGAWLQSWDQF